jgi:hypothetical protein
MSVPEKALSQSGDAWDFQCPGCEFVSTGWPTKKSAMARGAQHVNEHESGGLMQDMGEFIEGNGLMVNPDGSVSERG